MIGRAARRRARVEDREAEVAGIWADAFRRSEVARDADFFELGGDSLTGLVIVGEVEERFGCSIGLETFATVRTPAALARLISDGHGSRRRKPAMAAGDDGGDGSGEYPLSLAQEPIWTYCHTTEASGLYGKVLEFEVFGPVEVGVLRETLARLVERNAGLRTVFAAGPLQRVLPSMDLPVSVVDAIGARDADGVVTAVAREHANHEYDLERGPLAGLTVIRLGAERYYLVLYAHNLICDRVSAQAIWRELCTEYDALLSGEARPPARRGASYGEFAARQRRLGGAGGGGRGRARRVASAPSGRAAAARAAVPA